ncbi:MAG: hypothetical protein OQL20_01655 [Sedimenticola sp.]|nr:hypothetical protein [Sedimenticola sp.]
MIVIGVNEGSTEQGRILHDGGCVLLQDGNILSAISEERLTREKRSGGYSASFSLLTKKHNIEPCDVDLIVTSTCCSEEKCYPFRHQKYQQNRIISCNHHLSHAYSAFFTSPFKRALVIVIDAGGNILDPANSTEWWKCKREQHSYYIADDNNIEAIGSDFEKPYQSGIGELYRAFTYYLGWPSSRFSGNTMALSAFGNTEHYKEFKIFEEHADSLCSSVVNSPSNPINMIDQLLNKYSIKATPRIYPEKFSSEHYDLAAWIQTETESALVSIINRLISNTGIRDVCLVGGVAYNCKSINTVLYKSMANNIYVGPVSGDHGQALGNAIYGYKLLRSDSSKISVIPPYLGPSINTDHNYIEKNIRRLHLKMEATKSLSITKDTAALISAGKIIGWFQGKSEFGPRALGNRSIIASPDSPDIKSRINKIKGRDVYMPVAPAVIEEEVSNYFSAGATSYMSAAVQVINNSHQWIQSASHFDQSARVQIVSKLNNPIFYDLIKQFHKTTSIPLVLNTSFNGAGEPIVENITDALEAFHKLDLDYLVINETIISKKHVKRTFKSNINKIVNSECTIKHLADSLPEQYPNLTVTARERFLLLDKYIEWIKKGKKITTIRYKKGAIDRPEAICLPLHATNDFSQEYSHVAGRLLITGYELKPFGSLTNRDAMNDGFSGITELHMTLQDIYGPIENHELISVYTIELIEENS